MDRILDSGSNDWGSTPHGDTQKDLLSQTAGPFLVGVNRSNWQCLSDRCPTNKNVGVWMFLNYVLTKCQTKGSTMFFLAPKIRFDEICGILRRFAKYRLLLYGEFSFLSECIIGEEGDFCHSYYSSRPLFITFRFVDSTFLPESETRFLLLPFSKDLTSGHETIVFGGWNYIVWRVKLYCLARETILFRARFVCFSKTKCIVF